MDSVTTLIKPYRLTVSDYHRMVDAGILHEDSRVELIRGQLVEMPAIGAPHFGMVNRLNRLLSALLAGHATVSVQGPVQLDDGSEPEPDIAVLRFRADDYETAIPTVADTLLIIEVADSTLAYDRAVKAPLYAESGIPEYWIVNLIDRRVEVHRQPTNGQYAQVQTVGPGDTLDIAALPGASLLAAELLRGFQAN